MVVLIVEVAVVMNLIIMMVFPTPVVLVSVLVRIVMLVVGVELVGCPENDGRRVGGHWPSYRLVVMVVGRRCSPCCEAVLGSFWP